VWGQFDGVTFSAVFSIAAGVWQGGLSRAFFAIGLVVVLTI